MTKMLCVSHKARFNENLRPTRPLAFAVMCLFFGKEMA